VLLKRGSKSILESKEAKSHQGCISQEMRKGRRRLEKLLSCECDEKKTD
jgi:hypothetical protein